MITRLVLHGLALFGVLLLLERLGLAGVFDLAFVFVLVLGLVGRWLRRDGA